jgi:dolichol-phosphate mannosyltransferase
MRDTDGGFKCWRRSALEAVNVAAVRSNGYAFQIEMTYRAWRRGLRIQEIPIIFMDRTVGDSKMTKRISLEALWIAWYLRARTSSGGSERRIAVPATSSS